ncbi:MAG: hypothetical protein GY679_04900 [Mycoplasma sp.]|nr:hypothetical protein [Mycoplasma sp.]
MKFNTYGQNIEQIARASIITALAIMAGMTGFIKTGVSIYLTAAPLFLSTLLLKTNYSLLSTIISILIVDCITGWIGYTWISLIGYISGLIIVWLFSNRNKAFYMLGVTLGSLALLSIYTLLWWFINKDPGTALVLLGGTSIQMSFVWVFIFILYKKVCIFRKK